MDTNSVRERSGEPSRIRYICIREYVAEIRKIDWKKCCPFELSGNPEVDNVLASLVLEADNALVNSIPEDTQAPNVLRASQVGNAEVHHEARSENPNTDEIIGNDAADNTINGETLAAATITANDIAQGQNETNVTEDAIVAENDKPQDPVIADNAAEPINTPSDSAGDAIATGHHQTEDGIPSDDGSSDSFSIELVDADRCPDEHNITPDSVAPRNDRRRRNLVQRTPQKFRRLADIYKDLGSCIYANEGNVESEFTDETSEDDSDEVTLGTFIRGKRSVRANSKRIDALKNKRKTREDAEARLDKGKRAKSVSEDNRGNDSEPVSKYYLRKKKINEPDLQMTNKRKEFSPEDSHKSNRETVQEDCAREVLKLLDGNQMRITEEENHSGPSRGVKRAQDLVQSPTAVSIRDVETASGPVEKRIRESSPPTDSETMAVLQLLRLSNEWVNTKTPSKTATENAPLSAADHESPLGLDGIQPPDSGPMVSKPPVEVNVEVNLIDGAALPHAEKTKSESFVCRVSRNPAEFSIPNAKKFMRRGKAVKTV